MRYIPRLNSASNHPKKILGLVFILFKQLRYPVCCRNLKLLKTRKISHTITEHYRAIKAYKEDPIFHCQDLVCREFVQLRPVPSELTEKIPASFEFRSFWWRGQCVGAAQYWSTSYDWNQQEQKAALLVATEAAMRLNLPFVVIDVAQKINGEWVVIECNDGQESGYAAISPFTLWQNLIAKEKELFGNKKLG
ncbi:ATP-grasp domain-containing protein [Calothrix sp. FACHB-156]|nr:ATP-grasp domain-containing protein [Calothrix sp. FACHB-156]